MNIPKIPMYMYCHLNRSKKHGGSTYIYRNDELGLNHWENSKGSIFYVMPVSEADNRTDENAPIEIPKLPDVVYASPAALFSSYPQLLEKAIELYGEGK